MNIYDMLLVVGYLLLLMCTVGFIFFLKYHIKKVASLEEQVEFYRQYALKKVPHLIDYPIGDEEEQ